MTQRVSKYRLPLEKGLATIAMQQGAEFLWVGAIEDGPWIWVRETDGQPLVPVKLELVSDIGSVGDGKYIGTIDLYGGDMILHVFERHAPEKTIDERLASVERRVGNLEGHK